MRPLEGEAKTLGERLRLLRRTQAVTMDMLVTATRVQRKYLEALEWGRYDDLPDPMYTRNYIRAYARYLGADEFYFLEMYAAESARSDLLAPHRLPRTRVREVLLWSWPQVFAAALTMGVFFLFLVFLVGRIAAVFTPPEILLETPIVNTVVTVPYITVEGKALEEDVEVVVNGTTIVLREDGSFLTEVALREGPNVVHVEARRRYSRPLLLDRVVVYDAGVDN